MEVWKHVLKRDALRLILWPYVGTYSNNKKVFHFNLVATAAAVITVSIFWVVKILRWGNPISTPILPHLYEPLLNYHTID